MKSFNSTAGLGFLFFAVVIIVGYLKYPVYYPKEIIDYWPLATASLLFAGFMVLNIVANKKSRLPKPKIAKE